VFACNKSAKIPGTPMESPGARVIENQTLPLINADQRGSKKFHRSERASLRTDVLKITGK
jgi:hypothetical protein